MTDKILITGGAGFIGGFLAKAFADRGSEVHVLDDMSRGRNDTFLQELSARPNVRIVVADLMDRASTSKLPTDYRTIFHLAARLGVSNVLARPYETLSDNVALLAGAIGLARLQTRLDRFMFASTSEVYAGSLQHMDLPVPTPETFPLAVTDLAHPRTSYMLSKIYGEAMVIHSGLPYTIVRPHNIYGPRMGQLHVVPQLLEKAHNAAPGAAIEVFSVDHRRTFCFIDDAVAMLVRLSETAACAGQVLNLGNEAPEITIGELAEIVISTVGKPLSIARAPATPGSPVRRAPAMARMTALTGQAARVTPADGVRRTYEWYRDHVFSKAEAHVAR